MPEKIVLLVLLADVLVLTTALLFRKPKQKSRELTNLSVLTGYYSIIASLLTLILAHFAVYHCWWTYFVGFSMLTALFAIGLNIVVTKRE